LDGCSSDGYLVSGTVPGIKEIDAVPVDGNVLKHVEVKRGMVIYVENVASVIGILVGQSLRGINDISPIIIVITVGRHFHRSESD
jgi:hypothetical protein